MNQINVDDKTLDSLAYQKELVKHMIRDQVVLNHALKYWVTPQCFTSPGVPQFYSWIVDIFVNQIRRSCSSPDQWLPYIKPKLQSLDAVEFTMFCEFISWMYVGDLASDYYGGTVRAFAKRKTQHKAITLHKGNLGQLGAELVKVEQQFATADVERGHRHLVFKDLILPEIHSLIPLGFNTIDCNIGGIARGDYAILVGFTGAGKTALSSFMAKSWAMHAYKVAFVSFEDTKWQMASRFYSGHFRIPYSDLRSGRNAAELQEKFRLAADQDTQNFGKMLKENLLLLDMKVRGRLSPAQIYAELESAYEDETLRFQPDIVIIDQMQFLDSEVTKKDEQLWQTQGRISNELDALSHKTIGGKPFVLLVNHQAKGKPRDTFTREDIQGFKAIDNPADWVFGLGRADPTTQDFRLFSLKARHAGNFSVPLYGDLAFMSFSDKPTINQEIPQEPVERVIADQVGQINNLEAKLLREQVEVQK